MDRIQFTHSLVTRSLLAVVSHAAVNLFAILLSIKFHLILICLNGHMYPVGNVSVWLWKG